MGIVGSTLSSQVSRVQTKTLCNSMALLERNSEKYDSGLGFFNVGD